MSYKIEIIITDPNGKSSNVELEPGQYFLGREEDCEIRFPESAKTISRKHAVLSVKEGQTTIEDLDSRGGTMVNGRVISACKLESGDIITLSKYMVRVILPETKGSSLVDQKISISTDTSDEEVKDLAQELESVKEASKRIRDEISKRIIGQEEIVKLVWATIISNGHCLMIGVPGLAKTFMVTTFADALGLNFKRIQFTPDLMPSDIIGSQVIQEEDGKRQFEFVQGPIFTQLLLADPKPRLLYLKPCRNGR